MGKMQALIEAGEFKGQKKQDQWVLGEVLPAYEKGFFLELAAADGVVGSNTYVMEKHYGWSGLCIEPNPLFFEKLQENRSCKMDSSVVSNQRRMLDFRVDNGHLGGIVADDTDNNIAVRGKQLVTATIISLQAKQLNEILAEHAVPKMIDYFSLDVEGSEERVISTLNFERYQFKCITIERPTKKVNEVLFDNGYLFVKNVSFDSFYVHPDVAKSSGLHCEKFEQQPKKER